MKKYIERCIEKEPKWQEPAEWMALGMVIMSFIMAIMMR